MYYVKPSALLPGKAICWIELIAGNNSKMKRSRRHVPFSLSLAGVSVLLVVLCGILFQNANSHVIPNKSIAKSLTKTDAPVKVEMEYGKHGLNVVGELQSSREKSREKRWAFPAVSTTFSKIIFLFK